MTLAPFPSRCGIALRPQPTSQPIKVSLHSFSAHFPVFILITPAPYPPRRGITLQRFDIPMQPSQDFPTAELVELIEAAPEPTPAK